MCCIASVEEAELAIRHGADAIGLVSEMPSGPGVIPDDRITEIAASTPPGVSTFLLTSSRQVDAIVEQQRRSGVDTIQLCDEFSPAARRNLRSMMPGVSLVQVIHVVGERALEKANSAAREADALLLDSGNPSKTLKELGGTGRTHDWALSRAIRETVDIPVWLAGGLAPDNIADAVQQVRPHGVDVCTGLRTNGSLDEAKLVRFVQNMETASVPGGQ